MPHPVLIHLSIVLQAAQLQHCQGTNSQHLMESVTLQQLCLLERVVFVSAAYLMPKIGSGLCLSAELVVLGRNLTLAHPQV